MRLLCIVLFHLHSILAGIHDFAVGSPIDFSARKPPVIITMRNTRNKIMAALGNLQIDILAVNFGKTTKTQTVIKYYLCYSV